jgi:hypothetical protein
MENLLSVGFDQGFGVGLAFWALLIWSLTWKGIALWKAAKINSRNWFIALLVINTAGILEILYIYVISKKSPSK